LPGGSGATEDIGTLAKPTLKNSPNPFRNSTSINYNIVETAKVEVEIYNITGQITKALVNETKTPGTYSIVWDATSDNGAKVPNGVYFCKLRASTENADIEITNKMLLVK
jgi:flagellar hook assembly protein FlgD